MTLDSIVTAFTDASARLADATDGQFAFGRVTIVNNSGAGWQADVWVLSMFARSYAIANAYGIPYEHVVFYFGGHLPLNLHARTLTHELIHQAWGVRDEYTDLLRTHAAECAPYPAPAGINYCLMESFFRGSSELTELCVSSVHDPDMDTAQSMSNGESCWETIAHHPTRPGILPAGLPDEAPPMFVVAPEITVLPASQRRFVLCVDRSNSMNTIDYGAETRLDLVKLSAHTFLSLVGQGDVIGVTSFNQTASTDLAMTTVNSAVERILAINAVDGLMASGDTSIGSGLIEARSLFDSLASPSCSKTIILISDGFSTQPPSELDVIPDLISDGIVVVAIDIGPTTDPNVRELATATGGVYYRIFGVESLFTLLASLSAETRDGGVISFEPGQVDQGKTNTHFVFVDSETGEASFVLNWLDLGDDLDISLKSPLGNVITVATANNSPDVDAYVDEGTEIIVVRGQTLESGDWEVNVTGNSINGTGRYDITPLSHTDNVGLTVMTDRPVYDPDGDIRVLASPKFLGQAVVGASVDGTYTNPDGQSGSLVFFDDGTNGDWTPGDGVYTSVLNAANASPGIYNFSVHAENQQGVTFEGEAIDSVAAVSMNVPPFERATTTTTRVSETATSVEPPTRRHDPVSGFTLSQNYPNPFNPVTTIHFSVASRGRVTLRVYDAAGRLAATLLDSVVEAGPHEIQWDGRNADGRAVASGVYFYRLAAGDVVLTRKAVLLK